MRSRAAPGPATLLDAPLLELVLSKLPADDLATAQLCCSEWAAIIHTRALWRRHCTQAGEAGAAGQAGSVDWRQQCLQQHAAQRWREGHAVTVASKHAHTASITAMAALGDAVLTGSSDGSAALWHLAPVAATRPTRYSLSKRATMQHRAAVVAVALASDSLAVCATAQHAFLWREDKCMRQFKWQQPGPNITHVACAETYLVVAYADGSACVFDLYSGSLQLILRIHKSPISALLLQDMGSSWGIITGAGGEVACSSASNGACLWRLSTSWAAQVHGLALDCSTRVLYMLDQQGHLRTWQAARSVDNSSSLWKFTVTGKGSRAAGLQADALLLAGQAFRPPGECRKMALLLPAFGRPCVIASTSNVLCITNFPTAQMQRVIRADELLSPISTQQQHGRGTAAASAPAEPGGKTTAPAAASGTSGRPVAASSGPANIMRGHRLSSPAPVDTQGKTSIASLTTAGGSGRSQGVRRASINAVALTSAGCVVAGYGDGYLHVYRFMTRP